MKKIIALILCLAILATTAVAVLAAEENVKVNPYENYLLLGDSIAAGCTLPGYNKNKEEAGFPFLDGTYGAIVKNELNADGAYTFAGAHSGMRVDEMLAVLDDTFPIDSYTTVAFEEYLEYEGVLAALRSYRSTYVDAIKNADVITLNFGMNDVLTSVAYQIIKEYKNIFKDNADNSAINTATSLLGDGVALEAIGAILEAADSVKDAIKYAKLIANISSYSKAAYANFKTNWDKLLGYIYTTNINPDLRVIVLGVYNPFTVKLSTEKNDILKSVGSIVIIPNIESVNYYLRYGSSFAADYDYVDVSEITDMIAAGKSKDGFHPNAEGHQYIADKILAALDKKCSHSDTVTLFAKKATRYSDGYTGDVFCRDCGKLLKQGTIITHEHTEITIPRGIGYWSLLKNLTFASTAVVTTISFAGALIPMTK